MRVRLFGRLTGIVLAGVTLSAANSEAVCSDASRGVASAYCEAIRSVDHPRLKSLYEPGLQKYLDPNTFTTLIKNMKIKCGEVIDLQTTTYGCSVTVLMTASDNNQLETTDKRTIYLLQDDHIRFDPFFLGHPASAVPLVLRGLQSEDELVRKISQRDMGRIFPLYGYDYSADFWAREESIEQIQQFWLSEATVNDGSPEKIPLSREDRLHANHTDARKQ